MFPCYFVTKNNKRHFRSGVFKSTPRWRLSVFANELFICNVSSDWYDLTLFDNLYLQFVCKCYAFILAIYLAEKVI